MRDLEMLEEKVLQLLPTNKNITKEELLAATGTNDRTLRHVISNLKTKHTIIASSRQKGYRKCKHTSEMSEAEIEKEITNIENCICEIKSKKKTYNKQLRQYVAYLRMLQKKIGIKPEKKRKRKK